MEIEDVEKVVSMQIEPLRVELRHTNEQLSKFISNAKWVAATVVIPILFFVLEKIF